MDGNREAFDRDVEANIHGLGSDERLAKLSRDWMEASARHRYCYNFTWLGLPIIQYPQDILALQEIIWRTRPDVIVETGIAHGGGLIMYASILELMGGTGKVVGVDIDIRSHNRAAIEQHPLSRRISVIEGSSTAGDVVSRVAEIAAAKSTMVILDSNHTDEHVYAELLAYSPFVTRGCYLVVFDTVIEELPSDFFPAKPWGLGNNPRTAVDRFVGQNGRFAVDASMHDKLQVTVARGGYLRCTSDK